jgi:hypothetical protein
MMNKSLLGRGRESSNNRIYGFQRVGTQNSRATHKKEPPFPAALKLITGRRQTEWTGATRCPNEDDASHKQESLIDRKQPIFFRDCLPCRPLAEFWIDSIVVPANAGTHNTGGDDLEKVGQRARHKMGRGVWVPAFAGTT